MVWVAEKEFHIPVTEHFLLMKFLNWFDEYNIQRYNKSSTSSSSSGTSDIQTLGD